MQIISPHVLYVKAQLFQSPSPLLFLQFEHMFHPYLQILLNIHTCNYLKY